MSPEELDLVETDDLVEAIHRRTNCCIMVYSMVLSDESEAQEIKYYGGPFHCIGLMEMAKHRLLKIADREEEE